MKFTKFQTKHYLISIFVLVVLTILIIPFPTESVPEWKVSVIDENYLPGANMEVNQRVEYVYFQDTSVYKGTTDKNGFVNFPKRNLWASFVSRFISFVADLFGKDTQTIVKITANDERCSEGVIIWKSEENKGMPLPDKLICP